MLFYAVEVEAMKKTLLELDIAMAKITAAAVKAYEVCVTMLKCKFSSMKFKWLPVIDKRKFELLIYSTLLSACCDN